MIKIISKNLLIVFSIFVFLAFSFIIYSQTIKLNSYQNGNQNAQDIKSSLKLNYNDPSIEIQNTNNNELNNFITCYQEPVNVDDFSDNLKNKFYEIESLFKSADTAISFSYEDLYSGLHISYNENKQYFSASTIKAPVVLYIYYLYINGKLDLNQRITYKPSHYVEGSGTIQYEEYGKQYTIKELTEKAIIDSDNVAYQMLASIIDTNEIKSFWQKLGSETFWPNNKIWGQISSKDGIIYMKELYKFTKEHPEISDQLLNLYFNSVCRLININDKNIKIAHKSGWNSATIHDMAIVYSSEPYVISINSLMGYKDYTTFFNKASILINEFHEIYWDEKANYCYTKIFK